MRSAIAIVAAVATIMIAGCSQADPEPTASATSQETVTPEPTESQDPTETPKPTETPEPGSAEALLPEFQAVLDEVDAASDVPDGEALVQALIEAGFDASAIERTSDVDSLGEPVTLVEVAVRVGDSCLVGQIGEGDPNALVMPPLASGTCLIGVTVPIE